MKISLNWAQWYSNTPLNEAGTDELVRKIGAQLGAVEEVVDWGKRYEGIVVARVVSCEKHPDADKLHVCKIDDGGVAKDVARDGDGYIQVVCGAPNVRDTLVVAWLPPGVVVPSTLSSSDPLKLESREIRGVVSNGMLASPKELQISDSHEGLLEIEEDAQPGTPFADLYGSNDIVIDVENKMFTHRPDCFGVLGVARELAGIQQQAFVSPDWYLNLEDGTWKMEDEVLSLEVCVESPELVPRFMAVAMSGIKVQTSPTWLQAGLTRVGIKPINNIVDITNYLMYLTAQPLHAYDADKLPAKGKLEARMSKNGDKLKLLNGKELELQDEASVLITSGDVPVGIGGVMGGSETEVDDNTKNIVIECASFDMYNIRKTSMKYGLFTEAVTRFNKGQSALQNDRVVAKAMEMVAELADGKQASSVQDVHGDLPTPQTVEVSADFINARLGLSLTIQSIASLLTNVEFVVEERGDVLGVTAPFWRTDIEIPEDVVEEVGRLYGYDHLPLDLPKRSAQPTARDPQKELKAHLRNTLSSAGANEVLTYNFVHGNLFEKVGQTSEHAYKLSNALSPELQYYRTGLTPSLLDKVHANIKAGYESFALFEINKVHFKGEMDEDEPQVPNEDMHLALVVAYSDKSRPAGAAYYSAQRYLKQVAPGVASLFTPLKAFDLSTDEWGAQLIAPYDPERSAVIVKDAQIWGVVGEFKADVSRNLKLPAYSAGFEVHTDLLSEQRLDYTPLSRFPSVEQDICLRVSANEQAGVIEGRLRDALDQAKDAEIVYTLEVVDVYQKDPQSKQITWRVVATSYERTLKAEHINTLLDQAAAKIDDATRV